MYSGASATSLGEGSKGHTPDPSQQDPTGHTHTHTHTHLSFAAALGDALAAVWLHSTSGSRNERDGSAIHATTIELRLRVSSYD